MPSPYPKYRPSFTPEELDEARSVVSRHSAPHNQVLRAKMVLILTADPSIGNTALAQQVGVHYQTVCKWRRRCATEGFGLQDHARSGRPSANSPTAGGSRQSRGVSTARPARASPVSV